VHPGFRRRGIAASLMRSAEIDAPTEKLFTSTNESNAAMRALCEKIGFVRSGIIENLDEGDPEIIYFKRLAPSARHPGEDRD
jgi:ribosomal protein S18 acetylase RimI-like enzyme